MLCFNLNPFPWISVLSAAVVHGVSHASWTIRFLSIHPEQPSFSLDYVLVEYYTLHYYRTSPCITSCLLYANSITRFQYTCPIHVPNTGAQYTCPIHVPNTRAQYTCPIHVSNTRAQYMYPIHVSNICIKYTYPIQVSNTRIK